MSKIVLIDGHSILNRAFYGVPDLTNSEGLHTNAVYGFLNIMFKIQEEEQACYLAVAFDRKEPTFRHEMYDAYKGTRKPMPQELHEQVPLIKEVLAAMGIPILTLAGYEADDILGTVACQCAANGLEVSVVSGDRDLLQLADTHIKIRIPKTTRGGTEVKDYYPEDVKREYLVSPKAFIDVKALMGDASDNIPGVPSIGEKTATSIISTYGSIENAYEHLAQIKPPRAQKALTEHYHMAQMSKELATICTNCPIEFSVEDAKIENLYTQEAYQWMKRLEFKSILARFGTDAVSSTQAERSFQALDDMKAIERMWEKAAKAPSIGFRLILSNSAVHPGHGDGLDDAQRMEQVKGLALCFGEQDCYGITVHGAVTGTYLTEHLKQLCSQISVASTMDLKAHLPWLKLDYGSSALDVSLAGYLLNPMKDTYEYDDLARDYLDMTVPSQADLLGKGNLAEALQRGSREALTCICYMGYVAWKAVEPLKEKLEQAGMRKLFEEVELPLVYSLYHMEQEGVHVEQNTLREYGDKLKEQILVLEQEIYQEAGEQFNINSPKQLGEVLFDHMKLPHGKKTKTGYSTAAGVLEKLAPDYPVVQKILDYRQLTKLNSTYADGLAVFIREDGRIHGTFNQTITATGRISSTEPNLQNIPIRMELGREIRKVFVPRDGYVFVDADYSQIELRILASLSGDERLIRAYSEAQDIHAITASQVFHTPLDEVTSLQRRNAKAVNFGIVYGISAFGLSEGLSISRNEAVEYIQKYFETYPGVKEFLDQQVKLGKEQGYVTSLFGRRRPIPELKSANFMQRSFGERVAMNSPIQGTAADIMKIAMISVDQALRERGLKSRIVLQVHDELLVETHQEEVDQVIALLEDKMKHAASLKVALEVEAHVGDNWFNAK